MEKEDILIELIKEKFDKQNEKFDRLEKENKKLEDKLDNIENNHIQHIYKDLEEIKTDIKIFKAVKTYWLPLVTAILGALLSRLLF